VSNGNGIYVLHGRNGCFLCIRDDGYESDPLTPENADEEAIEFGRLIWVYEDEAYLPNPEVFHEVGEVPTDNTNNPTDEDRHEAVDFLNSLAKRKSEGDLSPEEMERWHEARLVARKGSPYRVWDACGAWFLTQHEVSI
jgi:hypothetical protein